MNSDVQITADIIPDRIRDEWASLLATPVEHDHSDRISLLVFRLGSEKFGIGSNLIDEIISPGVIRPLPHSAGGVLRGVSNVNGRIRTVVWLDRFLNVSPAPPSPTPRLLVFRHRGWHVATVVDEVLGVRGFALDQLQELPSTHAGNVYGTGWFGDHGEIIARLDENALFDALRHRLT